MEYIVIAVVALLTSGLTLFSGFGLGTLLLPAFALFFPIDTAIAMTAIVHLINNLFKLLFVGKYADLKVVLRFGIPAIVAAYAGAKLLLWFSDLPELYSYTLFGNAHQITTVKLIIAILMLIFALMELLPGFKQLSFDKKYLPVGGLLSGFFGGISGHQGALRSAFLIKYGLTKEAFIGTGVIIASIIDFSRLFVYSSKFALEWTEANTSLLLTAIVAASLGIMVAARLLKKITMSFVQYTVSILLFIIAIGLGTGLI
jgi:uncharacterized membrane protein YfcA